ncbi:MAG: hypothetical protein KC561_08325 [Myxococcales bacterium]|nr:hypothetical protein [Myxococcales bacterium]
MTSERDEKQNDLHVAANGLNEDLASRVLTLESEASHLRTEVDRLKAEKQRYLRVEPAPKPIQPAADDGGRSDRIWQWVCIVGGLGGAVATFFWAREQGMNLALQVLLAPLGGLLAFVVLKLRVTI